MVAAKVTSGEIPSSGPASTVPRMLLNETWKFGGVSSQKSWVSPASTQKNVDGVP
jgi:hypothetical protein